MKRSRMKKIDERNQTGEHWILYELEIPDGTTDIIIEYEQL